MRAVALATLLLLAAPAPAHEVDPRRLPIGDGKISTSPTKGYVFSCQTRFGGGGAHAKGAWIRADGTFDFHAKPTVRGAVAWPQRFSVAVEGAQRVLRAANLPNHPTGRFPVSPEDEAFRYDRNPNAIEAQDFHLELPLRPAPAAQPSCVGLGPIGVLLTGAVFFNALDARGDDAVANEIQDGCQGHPERGGAYHYHSVTTCLENDAPRKEHSALAGYALDGFGIYGRHGEGGALLANADLDECHGHTHAIDWDGARVALYHYHATWEYPYTVGCFRGTPAVLRGVRRSGSPPGMPPKPPPPPR
jgi:hypothetical protein